ncbi:MAG TPA: glycosyltransferase, partial [Gemmatimonadales bacterium]|nr:glycosyltransferase [Gemmatimonadales bacterium]
EPVEGLVSIAMPFLAARPYIAEAIESVRGQTYPRWELWLVDDGSSDGTREVARAYAARDPGRIRLLSHRDGGSHGASAARNLALAQARGEFVAFLDADDVWLPQNLAEQVARLRAVPEAGVLYSRTLYWHSWVPNGAPSSDHVPRLRVVPGRPIPPPELLARCIQGKAAVPCTCSILIRRKLIDRTGGFEEQFPLLYDDQAFYAKLFAATAVLPVDGCWAKYRQHHSSMTAAARRALTTRGSRQAYLTWLEAYVRRDPAVAAALAPALRRELWRCRHPLADDLLDRLDFAIRRVERILRIP